MKKADELHKIKYAKKIILDGEPVTKTDATNAVFDAILENVEFGMAIDQDGKLLIGIGIKLEF